MLRRVLGIMGIVFGIVGVWAFLQVKWVEYPTKEVPDLVIVLVLGWVLCSGLVRLAQVFTKNHFAWLAVISMGLFILMIVAVSFAQPDGRIEWSWWQLVLGGMFFYGWPILDIFEVLSSEVKKKSVGMEVKDAGR